MVSNPPLKAPKTKPHILSNISTPFNSNLGDNQFDIMLVMIKVIKNGKPNARKSTIISCDIYSNSLIHKILSFEEEWIEEYIRWEVFLLKKVGFGLELSKCVLSNKKENLKYISPKSGCAVNALEGKKWENQLLRLPKFLISQDKASKSQLIDGFKITTTFLRKFSNSINKTLPFTRSNFIDSILTKQ